MGVAYQPKGACNNRHVAVPMETQIRDDLRLLRRTGFRSLVTYAATGVFGSIPRLARAEGFDGVIVMGLWSPLSEEERKQAVASAPYVDGYCVGNEGLGVRYGPEELASAMDDLRRRTGRPVTTSEHVDLYLNGPYREWLRTHSDWLFPLAHPFWAHQRSVGDAVNWLSVRYDYLVAVTGKEVVFKEAGVPTAGAPGFDENVQMIFFQELEKTGLKYFYFEAFDQPCKKNPRELPQVETHWGLFRADGKPKEIIRWLCAAERKS